MILELLAVLYVGVGAGWAAAFVVLRRPGPAEAIREVALLVPFWPMYGPFMGPEPEPEEIPGGRAPTPEGDDPLVATLRLARGAPLAALLPDERQARRLVAQVESAVTRLGEIDALLSHPDFSPEAAQARIEALDGAGQPGAARAARGNLKNIERLVGLRARAWGELQEVGELMRQLRLQAEVLRLSEGQSAALPATRALAQALVLRVEGLEGVLEDELIGSRSGVGISNVRQW